MRSRFFLAACLTGLACVSVSTAFASAAEPILLGEQVKVGEYFRCELDLVVEGRMKAERDGKTESTTLSATARHRFTERAEATEQTGGIGKAVRFYDIATSSSKIGSEITKRELLEDRRLTVAVRTSEDTLHFSPSGPLTREELDLIGEHFDTLGLPTLLPGKATAVGGTWKLSSDAAQHACLFDGLIKHELVGTLTGVADGMATFTITGTAEGVETGATARLNVQAAGKFDVASHRIVELVWEQTDERSQGAVTPASEVKVRVTLKRSALAEEPKTLSAEARAKVPEDKIPANLLDLSYTDPDSKYQFTYPRDWHVVGRTRDHLILRLLDKGQFVAQATFSAWKKAEAGKHTPADDFKATVLRVESWQAEGVVEEGEIPAGEGSWMYSILMKGKQDGTAVVQNFSLLAGPAGDQLAITLLAPVEKAEKAKGKEMELIRGLRFDLKK